MKLENEISTCKEIFSESILCQSKETLLSRMQGVTWKN